MKGRCEMKKIAFFDTKPYDRVWFEQYNKNFEIDFFELIYYIFYNVKNNPGKNSV